MELGLGHGCLLLPDVLDNGGKRRQFCLLSFPNFIFLIKKINKIKSENRLTRHRVIRVAGSTGGWPGLSRVLQITGFSGPSLPLFFFFFFHSFFFLYKYYTFYLQFFI